MQQDADVVKLAVTANDPSDNLRVLNLVRRSQANRCSLHRGPGFAEPDFGPCLGSPFTYAAFNKERGMAPGLPSLDDMQNVYGLDSVNPQTAIYGIIGDPVGHSLSPLIHNKTYRKMGINAVYVPFRVSRGDLPGFLKSFDQLPVRGYSVTIPHKEMASTLASRRDLAVEQTQAANTLLRGEEGWVAHNTDAQAAFESIMAHLPPTTDGTRPSLHAAQRADPGSGRRRQGDCPRPTQRSRSDGHRQPQPRTGT